MVYTVSQQRKLRFESFKSMKYWFSYKRNHFLKNSGLASKDQIWVLLLSLTGCVMLGKLHTFPKVYFSHLEKELWLNEILYLKIHCSMLYYTLEIFILFTLEIWKLQITFRGKILNLIWFDIWYPFTVFLLVLLLKQKKSSSV